MSSLKRNEGLDEFSHQNIGEKFTMVICILYVHISPWDILGKKNIVLSETKIA